MRVFLSKHSFKFQFAFLCTSVGLGSFIIPQHKPWQFQLSPFWSIVLIPHDLPLQTMTHTSVHGFQDQQNHLLLSSLFLKPNLFLKCENLSQVSDTWSIITKAECAGRKQVFSFGVAMKIGLCSGERMPVSQWTQSSHLRASGRRSLSLVLPELLPVKRECFLPAVTKPLLIGGCWILEFSLHYCGVFTLQ